MMFEEANFHLRVRFGSSDGEAGNYGTMDYTQLNNKPSINGHTLIGNLTSSDLGIDGGVGTIDTAMSITSTNPVQNKAITAEINTVRNLIPSIDTAMSNTSRNPVQNRVIANALETIRQQSRASLVVDTALSRTSTNPVQNKAIYAALDEIGDSIYEYAVEQGYTGTEQEFMQELYNMMLEFDRLIKYEDFDIIDTTLYMYRGDIIGTTIYI